MWHISLFDMFSEILVLNFDKGPSEITITGSLKQRRCRRLLLSATALRVLLLWQRPATASVRPQFQPYC